MKESKYDKLISDLTNRTKLGQLEWRVKNKNEYNDYILNSALVHRVFQCIYEKNKYAVLFVVKATPQHSEEYDTNYETESYEVLVVSSDGIRPVRVILEVDAGYVSGRDLRALRDLIQESNVDALDFLSKFE